MKTSHFPGPRTQTISTRAELDARLSARAAPAPHAQLTPAGPEAVDVRHQVNAMAEKRISLLSERLKQARQGFSKDHALALVRDKAKGDFERGR